MSDSEDSSEPQVVCSLCLHDLSHACYDVYRHPELSVPICLLCKDELEKKPLERDQDGVYDVCAWCRDGGALFLCDTCERAFCSACIENNLGSSALPAENEDWSCPHCKPQVLAALEKQLDTSKWDGLFSYGVEEGAEDAAAQQLLNRLSAVEDEIEKCHEFFEESALQRLEQTTREELEASGLRGEALAAKVQEEVEAMMDNWKYHADMMERVKVDLQEEIEDSTDVDLAAFYHARGRAKSSEQATEQATGQATGQAAAAVTFADVAAHAKLSERERQMYERLPSRKRGNEGDQESDEAEEDDDYEDDDEADESNEAGSSNRRHFVLDDISDAEVRAIVERCSDEDGANLPEFRTKTGKLLPVTVRKALAYCDTPHDAALLARYFQVEDADVVDDLGDVDELEADYMKHGRRYKRNWKAAMERATEAENQEQLLGAQTAKRKPKLVPRRPDEDVAEAAAREPRTGIVSRKKMPSKRAAVLVQRKRPRADRGGGNYERLQPGEREMKLESSPQTDDDTESEDGAAVQWVEPDRAKRPRPTPPQEKAGHGRVVPVALIDLTSDNDDDFAPQQPKAPATVGKRQDTAKRPAPAPAPVSASASASGGGGAGSSKKRAVPVNATQRTLESFVRAVVPVDGPDDAAAASQSPEKSGEPLVLNPERVGSERAVCVPGALSGILKPHQEEGIRFMWENVVGPLSEVADPKKQFGCILAHSMGLGKTLQVITLLVTVLTDPNLPNLRSMSEISEPPADEEDAEAQTEDAAEAEDTQENKQADTKEGKKHKQKDSHKKKAAPPSFRRALIVAPVNTIANWEAEFTKFLRLVPSETREILRNKILSIKSSKDQKEQIRVATLERWCQSGGILIIGYPLLETVAHRNEKRKFGISDKLRDQFLAADIVVADEAHMIRNPNSKTTKAMAELKTKRRIALTGSPLQNNLMEYYCMVNFVRPGFLGKPSQFSKRFAGPIAAGQHADSTPADVRKAKYRAHVLYKRLQPLIHRRDVTILQNELPKKREFVVYLAMTPYQKHLYRKYLELLRRNSGRATLFRAYQTLLLVWNHPGTLAFKALSEDTTPTQPTIKDGMLAASSSAGEQGFASAAGSSSSASTSVAAAQKTRREKHRICFASVAKEARSSYRAFAAREAVVDAVDADLTELTANMFAGPKGGKKARAADSASSEDSIDIEDDLEDSVEIVDEGDVVELESKRSEIESVSPTLGDAQLDDEDDDDELDKLDDEEMDPTAPAGDRPASPSIPTDWWREDDDGSGLGSGISENEIIQLGPKVPFVLEVIAHAARRDEKVLIFSNSLVTLDFLETVLRSEWYKFLRSTSSAYPSAHPESDPNKQFRFWRPGTQFLRLDGAVGGDTRQQHVDSFNSASSKASVFLISTKAGNMGINLVGANRVIIFDTSWNPANDLQALFRCYRYGQEKPVFVYRLLAYNSMEEKIYKRQVVKSAMAARIVDKIEPDRVFTEKEHAELFQFEEEVATRQEISDVLEKNPRDPVLTAVASIVADSVLSIRDHEPLLEDKPEEKLTEEEQNAAEEDYQTEIHPPPPPPPAPVVPLFDNAPPASAAPSSLPDIPGWNAFDPFLAQSLSTALRNPSTVFGLPVETLEQMWHSLQMLGSPPSNLWPGGR